jgi:hypothetical protein
MFEKSESMLWPIVIAILILILAYVVFYVAPSILDFGKSFLFVIMGFLVIFIGAAMYVMYSLPVLGKMTTKMPTTSISVPDVVVSE